MLNDKMKIQFYQVCMPDYPDDSRPGDLITTLVHVCMRV